MNNNDIKYTCIDQTGFLYAGTSNEGVFKSISSTFPGVLLNTIITGTTFCAGTNISVKFTMEGAFESDNKFYAQISDASGNFANAVIIGTLSASSGSTISSALPAELSSGNGYRIRVISTNPEKTANDNGSNLTINALNSTLSQPADDAVNVDLKPQFTWSSNNCASTYTLEISKLQDFSVIDITKNVTSIPYTLTNNLDISTEYWWRIGVKTTDGLQKFTESFKFKTSGQTSNTHDISMAKGWNIISTYILTANPDMFEVFNTIINDVTIVKNGNGEAFIPSHDINNIGDWNIKDGYHVYMQNSAILEITGDKVDFKTTEYNLNAGWSIISYIKDTETSVIDAFASLTNDGNLVIVKDNYGNVYIPAYGINTIGNLVPGQGYQIYLTNLDVLTYPGN
jgi:hypothetical protein